jgi:hypothetical protein
MTVTPFDEPPLSPPGWGLKRNPVKCFIGRAGQRSDLRTNDNVQPRVQLRQLTGHIQKTSVARKRLFEWRKPLWHRL